MKFITNLSLVSAMFALVAAQSSHAAVIAIIDSGTDIQHAEISSKIWNNPGETDDAVDNDDNGYVDDLHGWNFVDNNNKLVDRALIGTFSPDVYKYFEIQTKALNGVATPEEKAWVKTKLADKDYYASLEKFGGFVHGTHVAGISAKDADAAKLMILKMIPTATSQLFAPYVEANASTLEDGGMKEKIVYMGLDYLAAAQGKGMEAVAGYITMEHPRVANCSFGTSRDAIKPLLKGVIEAIMGPLTEEQLNVYANYFVGKTVEAMKASFIAPSPDTLFVMAAGNDGTDNDVIPSSPANVKTENAITVAATLGRTKLASFSNYGETMVDIAAPGVGIKSTIPGGDYVQLSGTSQAAPYITNLAGKIMDANPKLSLSEVKMVMMETVDKKDFLVKKVKSAGIANQDRAVFAAKLTTSMSVSEAIEKSRREVRDIPTFFAESLVSDKDLFVMPLQSFFR